jgi:Domain of unknown function (DUF4082)
MSYNFPNSPYEGQEFTPPVGGQTYVYRAPRWLVKGIPPAGGGGGGGTSGTLILDGTLTPTTGVGEGGNYYLDTDDHLLYGPKAAGTSEFAETNTGPTSSSGGDFRLSGKFKFLVPGQLVGARFYRASGSNLTTRKLILYSSGGAEIAQTLSTTETAATAGWFAAKFSTPLPINANDIFTIAYDTGAQYVYTMSAPGLNNPTKVQYLGSAYGSVGVFPPSALDPNSQFFVDLEWVVAVANAWPLAITSFTEAPTDGQNYARRGSDKSWQPSAAGVTDAPNDGQQYGRQSLGWTVVTPNPTWTTLTGKPATFPPTVPIAWTDVSGKPATYPPTVPIAWTDVSGKPTTFPPTVPIAWTDVSGKPATFPPTLPITESNVTNLVADLAAKAPLDSPVFTGDARAVTPSPSDNDTSIATTAFVTTAIANDITPWAEITGKPSTYPPALPINESDVSGLTSDLAAKAPLASPIFTGDPKAPTPTAGDNDTSIATTAFVAAALAAVPSSGITNIVQTVVTSSTTYTKPAGLKFLEIQAWGGGGSGGGTGACSAGQASIGAGGYSGSYAAGLYPAASIGASTAITIGSGGAGAVSTGNPGTATSFGSLVVTTGGQGGAYGGIGTAAARIAANGYANTQATAGQVRGWTNTGDSGLVLSGTVYGGGRGAPTYPLGGTFYTGTSASAAAPNTGAGGDGALGFTTAQNGNAGGSGVVIYREYF